MSKQEDFDKFVKNTAETISHQWGTEGLTYADLVNAGNKCAEYGYQYAAEKTYAWLAAQKELIGISFEKDFYARYKQFMKDGKL